MRNIKILILMLELCLRIQELGIVLRFRLNFLPFQTPMFNPSNHVRWLTTSCNYSSRSLSNSSGLPGYPYTCGDHIDTHGNHTDSHIHKSKCLKIPRNTEILLFVEFKSERVASSGYIK